MLLRGMMFLMKKPWYKRLEIIYWTIMKSRHKQFKLDNKLFPTFKIDIKNPFLAYKFMLIVITFDLIFESNYKFSIRF